VRRGHHCADDAMGAVVPFFQVHGLSSTYSECSPKLYLVAYALAYSSRDIEAWFISRRTVQKCIAFKIEISPLQREDARRRRRLGQSTAEPALTFSRSAIYGFARQKHRKKRSSSSFLRLRKEKNVPGPATKLSTFVIGYFGAVTKTITVLVHTFGRLIVKFN
jgi:hypothetical protein